MTLAALARQLNTTTMTIYRRLKRNGVSIDELRDSTTGNLTPAGVSIIAALFDEPAATAPEQPPQRDATSDTEQGTTEANAPRWNECDVLRAQLEGARDLIEQLTGERDELRRQLAAAQAALAAEQADRANERRLLTGTASEHAEGYFDRDNGKDNNRRSWFYRLFNKT